MPSQLAIVITASALTGAAQAAIKGLGGSMMQMGRTGSLATNKLTSEYSALTQRVGMLNSKLAIFYLDGLKWISEHSSAIKAIYRILTLSGFLIRIVFLAEKNKHQTFFRIINHIRRLLFALFI